MRQRLAAWEATGAKVLRPYYLGLLAEVYGWCSEGFHSADLRQAKPLLDALS